MHRFGTLTLTLAALALPLAACGGDDDAAGGDSSASVEAIAAAFVEQGAPEDEATCVAEQVEGELTMDDIDSFTDADDPEDVDADVLEAIGLALGECTG